jgi:hypothetical protein
MLKDDEIYIKKEFYDEMKDLFVDKTSETIQKCFEDLSLE